MLPLAIYIRTDIIQSVFICKSSYLLCTYHKLQLVYTIVNKEVMATNQNRQTLYSSIKHKDICLNRKIDKLEKEQSETRIHLFI